MVAAAGVVGVVAGHRRAQSAADLAALAGAAALQDGHDACARASALASRNGVTMGGCVVDGWNVRVAVVETVRLPGYSMRLEGRSHAGPVLSAPTS
jgi:secretion/DNA translocation related TadE-like protein